MNFAFNKAIKQGHFGFLSALGVAAPLYPKAPFLPKCRLCAALCIKENEVKVLILATFILLLSGCYKTENGIVFGAPKYESRDIPVTQSDLEILEIADKLLNSETAWLKDSKANCDDREKYNLICALYVASIQVAGTYEHRRAALQEVRFAIDDSYKSYWQAHRLRDFNANPKTKFSDIKQVINTAKLRVKRKLNKNA